MTVTFEMNGKGYRTDEDTLRVLREQVAIASQVGDYSAVRFLMAIGEAGGRIVEMTAKERRQYAS